MHLCYHDALFLSNEPEIWLQSNVFSLYNSSKFTEQYSAATWTLNAAQLIGVWVYIFVPLSTSWF